MNNKVRNIFLVICCFVCVSSLIYSQPSVMPTSLPGTNSLTFDGTKYIFSYTGQDGSTLSYTYPKSNEGSLHNITATVNNNYTFYPSYYGGPTMILSDGSEQYPFPSDGLSFNLRDIRQIPDTNGIRAAWDMTKGNDTISYNYDVIINGRTLIIRAYSDAGNRIGKIFTDRCESVANPFIIGVPYLTMFNILYSNHPAASDKVFMSLFFDWTLTNSSELRSRNDPFSDSSKFFAPNAIYNPFYDGIKNNQRNKLDETIYLTIAPEIENVFPNLPNPTSPYKTKSINSIVWDYSEGSLGSGEFLWAGRQYSRMKDSLSKYGNSKFWMICHTWQRNKYDCDLPDVTPPDPFGYYGSSNDLQKLISGVISKGDLFSLHENYVDYWKNTPYYNDKDVATDSKGKPILTWNNSECKGNTQAYLMKPSVIEKYINLVTGAIKNNFTPNSSYLDVHTAMNPSDRVDYGEDNMGLFRNTYTAYKNAGSKMRRVYGGPVSGEGYQHMLYIGYFDDIEAQIHTGSATNGEYQGNKDFFKQGYYLPLFVDFDLLKMHPKAMVHGVGYISRFFTDQNNREHPGQKCNKYTRDQFEITRATEIAYGHGGFVPSPGGVDYSDSTCNDNYDYLGDDIDIALNEQKYVYPLQLLYGDDIATSILYKDPSSAKMLTASDYIKKYPDSFNDIASDNFMSKVYIRYSSGLSIYVNRHPKTVWDINIPSTDKIISKAPGVINIDGYNYSLPPKSSWVGFME
jgi:hypothetical protein